MQRVYHEVQHLAKTCRIEYVYIDIRSSNASPSAHYFTEAGCRKGFLKRVFKFVPTIKSRLRQGIWWEEDFSEEIRPPKFICHSS